MAKGSNRAAPPPYNPLDKSNLGISVADALLITHPMRLDQIEEFVGAGIYALYYSGSFPVYKMIAVLNSDGNFHAPIYVGKAVPAGARKGGFGLGEDPGMALHKRLREHANSIRAANNLNLEDFYCRYLVVDDIWIPLGESLLIEKFQPIWNTVLDGFGNHAPGSGRYDQQRSAWDVIHPGREWAERCAPNERGADQILAEVAAVIGRIGPR
jgi:hypothetical protein